MFSTGSDCKCVRSRCRSSCTLTIVVESARSIRWKNPLPSSACMPIPTPSFELQNDFPLLLHRGKCVVCVRVVWWVWCLPPC